MELWYDANSNRLVLEGLSEVEDPSEAEDYINDATVTASIFDGADAVEGAEDVAMDAAGSDGRYEKVFGPDDLELEVGQKYRAVITAVDGTDQLQITRTFKVQRR